MFDTVIDVGEEFNLGEDALREQRPPPRQLTLWAGLTFKGILLCLYINFIIFIILKKFVVQVRGA